ncbi:hypothetical protein FACS189456_1390 [Bacteroidia bacterium]|nr:hypothetical protein FACS189456_1390 [Bacteroidia bacterium]
MKILISNTTIGKTIEILLYVSILGGIIWGASQLQCRFAVAVSALFASFVAIYGWLMHYCQTKLAAKTITAAHVTNYFMWWTLGKMLLSIVFLFIYIKLIGIHSYIFLLIFAILYVEFLLFEMSTVRELNKNSK